MNEKNQLSQIGQIAVNVADLEASIAFYQDSLGLVFLFQVPGMAFFDCSGVRLLLDASAGWKQPSSILYFKVDEIRAAYQEYTAKGVSFVEPPHLVARMSDHDLWMAFFNDPSGNTMALMSEVQHEK